MEGGGGQNVCQIVFRLENGSGHGDVRGGGDGNGDVCRFGGARPNCV